jgi:hypothetical protein
MVEWRLSVCASVFCLYSIQMVRFLADGVYRVFDL